jgi:hypothetical protein
MSAAVAEDCDEQEQETTDDEQQDDCLVDGFVLEILLGVEGVGRTHNTT